jgi:hypothetical protein
LKINSVESVGENIKKEKKKKRFATTDSWKKYFKDWGYDRYLAL